MNDHSIIPAKQSGKQVDLFEEVELADSREAADIFAGARRKLLHPVIWKPMTGQLAADFAKPDPRDKREVLTGDYIRIDIPAPGLSAGDGHDWVKVESKKENIDPGADESLALTVKVCENPGHPEKGVAHFFAEGATSTFMIIRKGNTIRASYHGRNEKPNLDNPALGDKIRNAVVAIGAMAGISELQWKAFLKGLLAGQQDL